MVKGHSYSIITQIYTKINTNNMFDISMGSFWVLKLAKLSLNGQ